MRVSIVVSTFALAATAALLLLPAPSEAAEAVSPEGGSVVRVFCVRPGKPLSGATILTNRGTIRPLGLGRADVTGLTPGATVTLACLADGASSVAEHRVGPRTSEVFVTLGTAMVRVPQPVASKPQTRGAEARLRVNATPWAKCTVAGQKPRTTRFSVVLPPGTYRVVCSKGARKITKNVVMRGREESVRFDFR